MPSAGVAHGVEQHAGLLARARAQFDQGVGRRRRPPCPRRGPPGSTLRPGRVVLGQAGDLVEQPAAPVVVEVDGRQLLRGRGETGAHVGAPSPPAGPPGSGGRRWWGDQVSWAPVGRGRSVGWGAVRRAAQASRASRSPLKAQRAAGGEEVAVGGPDVVRRGGARAAPQDVLVHHELAVVLADGTFGGGEPGVRAVGARSTARRRRRAAADPPTAGEGWSDPGVEEVAGSPGAPAARR